MLSIIQDRGLEAIGRFYSAYRGVVIDDKDPDNLGRLKVVVPELALEELDWAFPKGVHGGINSGFKYLTPKVGSIVWVEFKNGDMLYPIWSYHGWALGEMPEDLKDNDTLGIVTPNRHKLLLKDKEGILELQISNEKGEPLFSCIINKDTMTITGKAINLLDAQYGIPLSDKVTEKLNNLEKQITTLKSAITSASASVKPNDGGASAFATLSAKFSGDVELTKIEDIANPNIKQ